MRIERGLSPNTVASYSSDLKRFFASSGTGPLEVSAGTVTDFLSESGTLSKRSQARLLSALRSFFDYLVMEGERKDNPCDSVDSPKLGRHIPSVLSVEEVEAIIESVDLTRSGGIRDRAILEVLYGCGLRVSEASQLKISCIYMAEGFVRIVGKGDKERLVPIGETALDALKDYLAVRPEPQSSQADDILFLNRAGRPLSRVSIFKMVKDQAVAAGIRKEISPHTFRHSFATHMIENGADLRVVQEMLGHESILTTEIYTHIDSSTWQRSVLEHHPRR
ncbi:MAG: tyrosine recombinase XerD [Bacteroidales bacterium]|nr:tyrosine recombinase XerD [Bacteroidales bacterium]